MLVPFNIFHKNVFLAKCTPLDIAAFNLIFNCSLLLSLSLTPFSLDYYNFILYILIVIYFFYSYLFKFKNISLLKKTLFNFIVFALVFLIIAIDVATKLELGWDAKFFYYIKALFFVEGQSFYDLNQFKYSFHPHLGSYFWAFYWKLFGTDLEYIGRLFYVFISCFSIFYVSKIDLEHKNINIIIFIVLFFFIYNYERYSGLQEILIFSFLIILSRFYEKIIDNKRIVFIIFFALACNLILWIKAEGIVYLIILLIVLNFSKKLIPKEKILFNAALIILILFKYFIYEISNNEMIDKSGHPYDLSYILSLNINFIIYKLKIIIPFFGYYLLNNVVFISGLIILIYNFIFKINKEYNKAILLYFILTTVFIFSAYLFRDMEIEYSIRTTMERIVFTISGFYLLTLVNFLNEVFKKFNSLRLN